MATVAFAHLFGLRPSHEGMAGRGRFVYTIRPYEERNLVCVRGGRPGGWRDVCRGGIRGEPGAAHAACRRAGSDGQLGRPQGAGDEALRFLSERVSKVVDFQRIKKTRGKKRGGRTAAKKFFKFGVASIDRPTDTTRI